MWGLLGFWIPESGFYNVYSVIFILTFNELLCGNICVPHKAFAAKLSSYLPIHTYNTDPQHLHLGLFLSSVTCAFYKCRQAHFSHFVCLSVYLSFYQYTFFSVLPIVLWIHENIITILCMQRSFHPIIHFSVSVLCIHESTNTLICAVTFKSSTHILILPSSCSSSHPCTFSSVHLNPSVH